MSALPQISHSRPYLTAADIAFVQGALERGTLASGPLAQDFRRRLARYFGVGETLLLGSGTAALQVALLALGAGAGDEVILPTYVCRSVLEAVLSTGALPVLCDVGPEWNLTPETVEPHLTPRTKAIIAVHIFGIAADARSLLGFGVPVVEDCCQSFGLEIEGAPAGTIGCIGVFSFHATKCLTTGEGGMLLSGSGELSAGMAALLERNRVNSPLSDLQAALGVSQLENYREMLQRRAAIADGYYAGLHAPRLALAPQLRGKSIFFRFPVRVASLDFEALRLRCAEQGVQVRRGVDELLHRRLGLADAKFPNAVRLFGETVSLPIYPALTGGEQERIIASMNGVLK